MNLNIRTSLTLQFFVLLACICVPLGLFSIIPGCRSNTVYSGNKYTNDNASIEITYYGGGVETGTVAKIVTLRSAPPPMGTEVQVIEINFSNTVRVAFPNGFNPTVGDKVILHSVESKIPNGEHRNHVFLATRVGEEKATKVATQFPRNIGGYPAEIKWTTNGPLLELQPTRR